MTSLITLSFLEILGLLAAIQLIQCTEMLFKKYDLTNHTLAWLAPETCSFGLKCAIECSLMSNCKGYLFSQSETNCHILVGFNAGIPSSVSKEVTAVYMQNNELNRTLNRWLARG